MKHRSWMRRSGMVLSAVVTMAAPAKAEVATTGKKPKPCKKSKSPAHQMAGDDEADTRPPPLQPQPRPMPGEGVRLGGLKGQLFKLPTASFSKYPWKTDIATTVFWIGELPSENNPTPNRQSSWDVNWTKNYGGFDNPDPDARAGYLPVKFTPKQNPFYVALPYNDMSAHGHKAEAREIIPWFKEAYSDRYKSVCKDRWIAIRKGALVCYAQWEDVGPFRTDDAGYVFGSEKPKPNDNKNAGLDVSPAVRDFLGLNGMEKTDWRFVDVSEVPPGPWTEHGENNHFVIAKKKAQQKAIALSRMTESRGGS